MHQISSHHKASLPNFVVVSLMALLAVFNANAQINYNFNDNAVPPGTTLNGVATVTAGALHLTEAGVNSVVGGLVIPDPTGGKRVGNLHAHWKSRIGGGAGGGADGYSFNWGTDLASPAGLGEEGTGTGLSVTVDTFDNGGGETGIEIKWGAPDHGAAVGAARIALTFIPKDNPGDGIYLRKDAFVDADLVVDNNSCTATFTYDGQTVTAFLPGYSGIVGGSFSFGARTGGANDNHWIDDLTIDAGITEIVTTDIIDYTNNVWRYHTNIVDPLFATPDAWIASAFDDSTWPEGIGVFGFETTAGIYPPGFNTFITPPGQGGGPSAYFRTHFNWSGATAGVTFETTNYVDDGIIVYLNGIEIYSFNMPPTRPMTWEVNTLPAGANPAPFPEPTIFPTNNIAALGLVAGDNVLAVELHQQGAGSSDDVFSMHLRAVGSLAPTITDCTQPTNRTVFANRSTTLSVFAIGSPALSYQWFHDGTAIDPLANETATASSLVISNMSPGDAGNYFVRMSNAAGTASSRTAVVEYVNDTNAPVLVGALGSATFDTITLSFDELLDNATAVDSFSYSVSDGATPLTVNSAILNPNGRSVTLILDPSTPQIPGTLYTVDVASMKDLAGNEALNLSAQFRAWVSGPCGGLIFEAYDTASAPGVAVSLLTSHPNFPNNPRDVAVINSFYSRLAYPDDSHEQYGGRIRGLFIAPQTGPHTFYIAADDNAELWLSTDEDVSHKVLIARETVWSADREWTSSAGASSVAAKKSAPVNLVAGQGYYIEALYKEGGGGDHCAVAVQPPGAPVPVNAAAGSEIQGGLLGYPAAPPLVGGPVTINQQPADVTTFANTLVSFSVDASNAHGLPVCYQWSRDGAEIPGAIGKTYSLGPVTVAGDNGAVFSVRVAVIGDQAISRSAVLHVLEDTNGPICVSAAASLTLSNIVIRFNEFVQGGTASDSFNYSVPGFTVVMAMTNADGMSVTLALDAPLTLGTSYQVTAQNVTDLAGNVITPNPCTLNFRTPVVSCGFLVFQAYRPESTADNNLDTTLLVDPNFPSKPSEVLYMSAFDTRTVYPNDGHEGYGALMFGYFIPPTSGNWIFYLRSDDSSRLYLNPNGPDPGGKLLIQEEAACCGAFSGHASAPQALTAGQQYYIEAILKEGTGGDYCQVAAKLDTDPRNPDSLAPISGAYLASPADPTGATLSITQQPTDQVFVIASGTLADQSFNAGDGGFTVETPVAFDGPWMYDAASGSWHTDGQAPENSHPNTTLLTSPIFNITRAGVATLTFVHKYSFEFDGTRWDGGQVRISVNGSPFAAVPAAAFLQNGYGGNTVAPGSASELKGQPAFTAESPGYVPGLTGGFITTIVSGSFNVGDTIQLQFMAAADTNTRGQVPNWQIDSFKLTQGGGAQQSVNFSVAADASRTPVFYQWYRDDGAGYVVIPGANSANYSFVPQCDDSGARFRVQIYIPGALVTSAAATLTVAVPNTAPTFAVTPPPPANQQAGPQSVPNTAHDIAPGVASSAPTVQTNILSPGDVLVLVDGVNDGDGNAGPPPGAEGVAQAIDRLTQKYLNFLDLGSGFAVTPSGGPSVVTGIRLYTANDAEERDPASYLLEGSVTGTGGPWTTISSGPLNLPSGRNPGGNIPIDAAVHFNQTVTFNNAAAYTSYRVTFPTLKNAAAANSMQIGEVELIEARAIPLASFCTTFDALPAGSVSSGTTPPFVDAGHLVLSRSGVFSEQNYWTLPLGVQPTFNSFKASWKTLLSTPGGADGFSFNIGQGIAVPNPAEEGSPTGLSLCVDTYNNGAADAGVEIKYNGARLAFLPVGPGVDTAGSPPELAKGTFVDATVEVTASGQVTFNYDGYVVVGQIPSYAGIIANTVIFGARTGGAAEDAFIDDLCLAGYAPEPCGDESGQTVHFLVSNDNAGLFGTQPAIAPNGTLTYTPAPGQCGTAQVTVVAMDNGGTAFGGRDTSAPQSFPIVVICNTNPPTLTCPQNVVAECTGALTPVTYDVSAVDHFGAPVPVTCVPPGGTGFRLGVSNVVCTATDSRGLSASCSFTVTVRDTSPPVVVCPSNRTATATSPNGAVVTYIAAASDPCGIASFDCTPPSGSTFPCGPTTVTCRAIDGSGNGASCSFTVTVGCQTNACPVARITAIAMCSGTQTNTFISPNGSNVCFVLDGSHSTDADGDALTYHWLVDGVPFAAGVKTTNCFPVGTHTITLIVDDGRCVSSTTMPVELITPCEAVEDLIMKVNDANLARKNKRPFLASLKAACASFERGNLNSGRNQLGAFINKVRAQVSRANPDEAALFTRCAQNIIDALGCQAAGQ